MPRLLLTFFLLGVLGTAVPAEDQKQDKPLLPPPVKDPMDFARDIQPILAARCINCHGPKKQSSGLRLDSGDMVIQGGNSGPILNKGKSADSLLIHVVAGLEEERMMPPKGQKLTPEEIGKLRAWIDQGARIPEKAKAEVARVEKANHWAFQPIRRTEPPTVRNATLIRNPIDAFLQARLEREKLSPAPEADRVTLIRRLHLDLLGLPPTPAEVDAFLNDKSPDAYERLVDRALASPHYGERWGRHWLDAARYADSDGYEKDTGRPYAYRYRDWVIDALNRDMPFDQFTIEQLAGDLLPKATVSHQMATGFHRNTLTNKEGGADAEEFRVAAVVDRASTTSTVWLGLTMNCCQCHDHKYDPLSQREFYQFYAFFNTADEKDISAPAPGDRLEHAVKMYAYGQSGKMKQALAEAYKKGHLPKQAVTWEENLKLTELRKLPEAVQKALLVEPTKRTAAQQQSILTHYAKVDKQMVALTKALTDHKKAVPQLTQAQALVEGEKRQTHIHIRGDFLRKGVEVEPSTPAVLPKLKTANGKGNRLDLAKWIVDPQQPLTPRVIVNWVWLKHFGRGIVNTPNDFGTQGEKPSHSELLDWLASEFMRQNWSLKKLHKLIVTSHAYRQSSRVTPELLQRDPLNVLLGRHPRLRLDAEVIRDNALSVSGLLVPTIGGPSVRPPQPAGIAELSYAGTVKWKDDAGPNRYRRGLYTWFQRTSPYPMLMTFDSPESTSCSVSRERSNTPLQALTLLNDVVFVETAQAMSRRLFSEVSGNDKARLRYAFRLCFGREPEVKEKEILLRLLQDYRRLNADSNEAKKVVGPHAPQGVPVTEAASWVALCRTLLNLDEFITRE
jgi:hypothetical protein